MGRQGEWILYRDLIPLTRHHHGLGYNRVMGLLLYSQAVQAFETEEGRRSDRHGCSHQRKEQGHGRKPASRSRAEDLP